MHLLTLYETRCITSKRKSLNFYTRRKCGKPPSLLCFNPERVSSIKIGHNVGAEGETGPFGSGKGYQHSQLGVGGRLNVPPPRPLYQPPHTHRTQPSQTHLAHIQDVSSPHSKYGFQQFCPTNHPPNTFTACKCSLRTNPCLLSAD